VTSQHPQQLYGVAIGSYSTNPPVSQTRNPTSSDVQYPIGQLWINTTGTSLFYLNNFTSPLGVLTANWLQIEGTATVFETLTGNSGGAISPVAGNINTLGTGSITIAGSGNTLTTELTGLTAHNVLVGAGTPTVGLIDPGTSGYVLTSNGASSDPTFQAASASGAVMTLDGDTGSATPSAGVITFDAVSQAGSSVLFSGSGSTMSLNVTDGNANTIIGQNAGNSSLTGHKNTALGYGALFPLTSGQFNTAIGYEAGFGLTSGSNNTYVGWGAGTLNTTSSNNTGIGLGALDKITTGAYNTALGNVAGSSYTSSESSNIVIGHVGVASESNVIRIGTQGSSAGLQNACYIAGITGVGLTTAAVVTQSGGQLGTSTITAGTGISVSAGASAITIAATGTTVLAVTPLTHASSPYTALSTDDFLAITGSVGTFTVKLPNAPATGKVYTIKDSNGVAATDNIAVTTVGGTVTIDGQTTYTMATNYQSINVIFDGTNYEVY
jgi:hypothetical protein